MRFIFFLNFIVLIFCLSGCTTLPHLKAWNALVNVFDADDDRCVRSPADLTRAQSLAGLGGASIFNAYRIVNDGCVEPLP